MGAIAEGLELTLAEVKTFLRVDGDDSDVEIQTLLDAAKDRADWYCQDEFDDDEGIPASVKLWVLQAIARFYTHRESGLSQETIPGTSGTVTWGDLDYSGLPRKFVGF